MESSGKNPQLARRSDAELQDASRARREADRALSMSERLARLHELCKQMTAVAGAAKRS
jgi:hypothetical protein